MDPFSAIIAALPMLAGLFGGGGSSSSGGLNSLFSDPSIGPMLKQSMFGNDARTLPYIDPKTGQVTFEGPNAPGLIGLQYGDALRNDPLKAAITRLAGGLLPTSAGFNGGAFPFATHFGQGNAGGSATDQNPANDGNGRGNTPVLHQVSDQGTAGISGVPGDSTGSGSSPRNRQLSLGPGGVPDFSQLLSQFRAMSAPALPPMTGRLAPPQLGI